LKSALRKLLLHAEASVAMADAYKKATETETARNLNRLLILTSNLPLKHIEKLSQKHPNLRKKRLILLSTLLLLPMKI